MTAAESLAVALVALGVIVGLLLEPVAREWWDA